MYKSNYVGVWIYQSALCLKMPKKAYINIVSEASFLYILSGQNFIKNAKNGQFGDFLKSYVYGQTVLPDRSTLNWTKIGGK